MIVIMGIDPALNNTGYGIIFYNELTSKIEKVKYGLYPIKLSLPTEQKLYANFCFTRSLIEENGIDEIAIENAFHNPKRAKGASKVREAIGAIKVSAVQAGVPIYIYKPQEIKKSVGGNGKASKLELAEEVAKVSGIDRFEITKKVRGKEMKVKLTAKQLIEKKMDHVSDAIAIALCRLYERVSAQREVS